MSKPTLSQLRSGLHFSASALKSFLICPWKFKLQYVEGAKSEFRPAAMVLGKAVHAVLADYHLSVQAEKTREPKEVSDRFDAVLDLETLGDTPVQYKKNENRESLRAVGAGLIEVYVKEATLGRILAVEQPFGAMLIDPRTGEELEPKLVGVFDLIEANDEGAVSVVELKTAARKWSAGQVDQDLQGSLYAEAVEQAGLVPEGAEVQIRYDVLVKNKKPILDRQYAIRRPGDREMALTIAVDALRAIEAGCFYRNPSWACSGCPFRRQCGV